ncbi:hypothetical protein J6590_041903 [Homalodisca vitripennis]|nr:hypothetical protein J6590_041903 [Homalodisca vitripennis]
MEPKGVLRRSSPTEEGGARKGGGQAGASGITRESRDLLELNLSLYVSLKLRNREIYLLSQEKYSEEDKLGRKIFIGLIATSQPQRYCSTQLRSGDIRGQKAGPPLLIHQFGN